VVISATSLGVQEPEFDQALGQCVDLFSEHLAREGLVDHGPVVALEAKQVWRWMSKVRGAVLRGRDNRRAMESSVGQPVTAAAPHAMG
jgi:hypothetical protein